MAERTIARLFRTNGMAWTDEAVKSLIGQEPRFTIEGEPLGRIRIVDARIEDGWVVAEMEPADG